MADRDLATLIRLSKWQLDELRRALKELQDQEATLLDLRRKLDEEVALEMKTTTAHAHEGGITFALYIRQAKERAEALDRAIAEIQERIEIARDELADGFKELKTYEIAEENRLEVIRQEQERRDQIDTDEQAITLFRRNTESEDYAP